MKQRTAATPGSRRWIRRSRRRSHDSFLVDRTAFDWPSTAKQELAFLTFDADPDAFSDELVSLRRGLMLLHERDTRNHPESSFFAGGPQATIVIQGYEAFEVADLVVIGSDGMEFFATRFVAPGMIELCRQTQGAIIEDPQSSLQTEAWEKFIEIDFASARLEGFTRPYQFGEEIGCFLTVSGHDRKPQFCQLTVITSAGFAEQNWSPKESVLFHSEFRNGDVYAWVRKREEVQMMLLTPFFMS
jgi:hypothetical protein